MKLCKFVRNPIGMGLLEVMVAVGLTGALSLTIAKLMENSGEAAKQIEAKTENTNLKGLIQEILGNPTACWESFRLLVNATNLPTLGTATGVSVTAGIKDKTNTTKYIIGGTGTAPLINTAPLTITAINLANYNATADTIDLVISANFKRSKSVTQTVKRFIIPLTFHVDAVPALTSCSTKASGGEWMLIGNADTVPGTNYIGTSDAQPLVFRTNAIERMRIDSAGLVGIGTTSPYLPLTVFGSNAPASTTATPNGSLSLGNSTTNGLLSFGVDSSGTFYSWIQSRHASATNFYSLALNPNGGNVGIGTTAPTAKLHTVGSIALGANTTANGANAVALGDYGVASGADSVTLGRGNQATGSGAISIGAYGYSQIKGGMILSDSGVDAANTTTTTSYNTIENSFMSRFEGGYRFFTNHASTPAEAVYFSNVGSLGVGTATPAGKLQIATSVNTIIPMHINNTPGESYSTSNSAANPYTPAGTILAANNSTGVASAALLIDLAPRDGAGLVQGAYFGALAGPSVSGGPANVVFGRRTGTSTWAETVRISSTGAVGIGTTTPGTPNAHEITDAPVKLHVKGGKTILDQMSVVAFAYNQVSCPAGNCGYFKDSTGMVHFRGAVQYNTCPASTMFTLPAGYRPFVADTRFIVPSSATYTITYGRGSWTPSISVPYTIQIANTGVVTILNGSGYGCSDLIYLDSISFMSHVLTCSETSPPSC